MKHLSKKTPNGAQLNLDALYQIAPSCFTEAKGEDGEVHRVVDFNKLRLLLGDNAVEDAPEVYDFTWVGKRAALQEAAAPISKTLHPCPRRLGAYTEPLHRGRQPRSAETAPELLYGQGQDDLLSSLEKVQNLSFLTCNGLIVNDRFSVKTTFSSELKY